MDRKNWYYKQRVTEAELDAAFDDAEQGVWDLVNDIGLFGVVYGADVSENAPQNLTVDVLGPAVGYDQAGQRVYWGITQDLDCATDYLGNPTVPTVPGEARWISIHARFARNLQDLRTDGNGDPVYFVRAESFVLQVVSGVAAGGGGHVRPAKPTDAILLCDIELITGQLIIVNADIDITRRDDFIWTMGTSIGVDDSGWSNIDPAADVQAAFDNVDAVVLDRDGTGDIIEDIIPDGSGTRTLGAAGSEWNAIVKAFDISAGTVTGDILPAVTAVQNLGTALAKWNDAYVLTLDATTLVKAAAIEPQADQNPLGTAAARFVAHLYTATIYNATLAGALAMSAAKAVTKKKVGLFKAMFEGADFTPTQSAFLGRTIFGFYGGGIAKSIYFEIDDALPDGVSLTAAWITWAEDTTNAGTARVYRRSNQGTLASISNEVTKTTANAWDDDQEITFGAPVTIDKQNYSYLIRVSGSGGGNSVAIGALAVSYTVTDLGVAAGG